MIADAVQDRVPTGMQNHGGDVAELVSLQAAVQPDAVAIASATRALTYGELDARADALAARLRGLGVGPDIVVGLCLPRSPAMVAAALGILKAGGAYLPLDPSYPTARLAFMLDDAKAPVLIAAHCAKDKAPTGNYNTITIDDSGRIIECPPVRSSVEPETAFSPKHL